MAAKPNRPEPKSMMLLGSGVVPVVEVRLAEPRTVKDSEGIVPVEFSEAYDGPEFSSQYIGSLVATCAFCKFSQYVPAARFTGPKLSVVSVQMLNPSWFSEQLLW